MKQKISISIDEKTIKRIKKELIDGVFRSKSHLIELAVIKLLEEKDE